jgi:selenide,water dikinase
VATVDVITPIVDDPQTFGRIAATNSISDVHAMGARPLLSLSIACFSPDLPVEAMGDILAGASRTAMEAGAPILGGHTIKDNEVKFGLAVIGEVHPERVLRSSGARPGDRLILTKPIGSAALATAFKQQAFDEEDPRYSLFVENMLLSNRRASEIAAEAGAGCATDVTGFGLAGHLLDVARSSGVGVEVLYDRIPVLDAAREALDAGFTCGGARANERYAGPAVSLKRDVSGAELAILWDPQTAGPLVFTARPENADRILGMLRREGYPDASDIGSVTATHCGTIQLV